MSHRSFGSRAWPSQDTTLRMPPTLIRTNSAVFNGLLLATAASVKHSAASTLRDGLDLGPGLDYVYNKHLKQEDIARQKDEEDIDAPPIPLHLSNLNER